MSDLLEILSSGLLDLSILITPITFIGLLKFIMLGGKYIDTNVISHLFCKLITLGSLLLK